MSGNGRHPTADSADSVADGIVGLDGETAARLLAEGRGNSHRTTTSRPLSQILRANLLTRFNAILGLLLAVILVVGPLRDAMFGVVLVTNALIGIVQELRARRTLDRLAILATPVATVVRDGRTQELSVDEVVIGDIVEARAGDQVIVDGVVVAGDGLEVDESLLSGEAEPVPRTTGAQVLSGSVVVGGRGWYRAEHVGQESYAQRLASDAQRFGLTRSELRAGTDRILRWVTWAIGPTAVLLVSSQVLSNESIPAALRGSVAGVGAMVPEGLVLLTSLAFAVAVVRLGRQRVLVQELAAVEGLARVTVVCVDKTGTLTTAQLRLADVDELEPGVPDALRAVVGAEPSPNATVRAIAEVFAPVPATCLVPFSSGRRWSAARDAAGRSWLLGSPDVLFAAAGEAVAASARVDEQIALGRRVLVLASTDEVVDREELPRCAVVAVLAFEEEIRPDAEPTVRFLLEQGVTIRVLSGDHPATVGAVAARVGVPGADRPVDASALPDDLEAVADLMAVTTVFGRVEPHRKRDMIQALQARGEIVGMTGDGVNDVLALKAADLGIAMGSGSAASRAVAQVVLLDSSWSALPELIAEGRRVIANVERVANLFVTKTVYAVLLSLAIGAARLPFPFLPRHLTIVSTLTIGIPAFFLALAPNATRTRPGFVGRVLRFAVPAGTVAAVATFGAYGFARAEGVSLVQARTIATTVLFIVTAWLLSILVRPWNRWRAVLVASAIIAFFALPVAPWPRAFFALDLAPWTTMGTALLIGGAGGALLEVGWRVSGWITGRRLD